MASREGVCRVVLDNWDIIQYCTTLEAGSSQQFYIELDPATGRRVEANGQQMDFLERMVGAIVTIHENNRIKKWGLDGLVIKMLDGKCYDSSTESYKRCLSVRGGFNANNPNIGDCLFKTLELRSCP